MRCDRCFEWYHPRCIGIKETPEELTIITSWFCSLCRYASTKRNTKASMLEERFNMSITQENDNNESVADGVASPSQRTHSYDRYDTEDDKNESSPSLVFQQFQKDNKPVGLSNDYQETLENTDENTDGSGCQQADMSHM